jgi:hypothetical protein
VSSCGAAVHNGTVGMVRGAGVPSGGGVVVMGTVESPCCIPEGWGSWSSTLRPSLCHPSQKSP